MRKQRRGLRFLVGLVVTMVLFGSVFSSHFGMAKRTNGLGGVQAAFVMLEGLAGLTGSLLGGSALPAAAGVVLLPAVYTTVGCIIMAAVSHDSVMTVSRYFRAIAGAYGVSLKLYKVFVAPLAGALIGQLVLFLWRQRKTLSLGSPEREP